MLSLGHLGPPRIGRFGRNHEDLQETGPSFAKIGPKAADPARFWPGPGQVGPPSGHMVELGPKHANSGQIRGGSRRLGHDLSPGSATCTMIFAQSPKGSTFSGAGAPGGIWRRWLQHSGALMAQQQRPRLRGRLGQRRRGLRALRRLRSGSVRAHPRDPRSRCAAGARPGPRRRLRGGRSGGGSEGEGIGERLPAADHPLRSCASPPVSAGLLEAGAEALTPWPPAQGNASKCHTLHAPQGSSAFHTVPLCLGECVRMWCWEDEAGGLARRTAMRILRGCVHVSYIRGRCVLSFRARSRAPYQVLCGSTVALPDVHLVLEMESAL